MQSVLVTRMEFNAMKAERDRLAEENKRLAEGVERLLDTIAEAQNCLVCASIGNPFEVAQTALDILDRSAGKMEEGNKDE